MTRKGEKSNLPREHFVAIAKSRAVHGMYKTRIYRIWSAMKYRCLNKNNSAYLYYGGRGITVCPTWLNFVGFFEDMGDSYKEDLTLDRIDGSKGYSKENCRWSTRREQSSNLKNNVFVDCNGERLCMRACGRKLGIHSSTILYRIKKGKLKIIK